ncbi:MAG: CDP-alcohol phosphatidyltransferase family protein, partial [Carbonactinosporaceae bacterium]
PSVAELRPVCQPDSIMGRVSAEHWAGRLYGRRISLHLTRVLLATRITPDGVTWLMIASGVLAVLLLGVPGVWTALGVVVLIQLQLIFDCSDGEIARWRNKTGATGVYLDRIGHYCTDAGLVAALGVRAGGGYASIDGWTTFGLFTALLVLFVKAETDLVHVARAYAGMPVLTDEEAVPRPSSVRTIRRLITYLPFHRVLLAIELSALALLAALGDAALGDLTATRWLTLALLPVAFVVVGGHLFSILVSRRLR